MLQLYINGVSEDKFALTYLRTFRKSHMSAGTRARRVNMYEIVDVEKRAYRVGVCTVISISCVSRPGRPADAAVGMLVNRIANQLHTCQTDKLTVMWHLHPMSNGPRVKDSLMSVSRKTIAFQKNLLTCQESHVICNILKISV